MSERDDDELDDASMKSMRAVWLSMRDEEPPAAGMSALMAAAASKAEQMRPQTSFWQRVLGQLRRPPALAFATVLVLIGGAVLVTRNQADKKVDSLSEKAPAGELRVREVERQNGQPMVQPDPGAPAAAVDEVPPAADPPPPKDVATKPPVVKPDVKADPKPASKSTFPRDQAGKNEPTRYDRFDDGDAAPKTGFSQGQSKDTGTVLQAPGGADAPVVKPTAPPPIETPVESRPEPKKPESSTKLAEETITVTTDSAGPKTPPNEQLAKQAESAAARGDCAAVRAIVSRLKQKDEAFYKTRLGKNAAVTKCL